MKKAVVLVFLATALFLTVGCGKKDDPEVKKKYAWAVGNMDSTGYAMILFTPDGGETWERQGEGSPALSGTDLSDIWAVDENHVWAIGSDNAILKTSDGGQTWNRVQAPASVSDPALMAISIVNKTDIWISGSNGTVYHSPDNGNTWTLFDTTYFRKAGLQGIWAVNNNKVFTVGGVGTDGPERGIICYTLDGGVTWDSIVPADDFNRNEWIGVTSSGNTIVIYGAKAHYMVSTDGGLNWKNDSVPGTGGTNGSDVNHLIMLNTQTWWGAFDQGQIFITFNGGKNWAEQQTGMGGYYLVGIDTWNSQLALVVGASLSYPMISPIIKTDDGGTSWKQKYTYKAWLWKVTFIKD